MPVSYFKLLYPGLIIAAFMALYTKLLELCLNLQTLMSPLMYMLCPERRAIVFDLEPSLWKLLHEG